MFDEFRDSGRESLNNFQSIGGNFHIRITNLFAKYIHDSTSQTMLGSLFGVLKDNRFIDGWHIFFTYFPITGFTLL